MRGAGAPGGWGERGLLAAAAGGLLVGGEVGFGVRLMDANGGLHGCAVPFPGWVLT